MGYLVCTFGEEICLIIFFAEPGSSGRQLMSKRDVVGSIDCRTISCWFKAY